jgi:hypothetical protein
MLCLIYCLKTWPGEGYIIIIANLSVFNVIKHSRMKFVLTNELIKKKNSKNQMCDHFRIPLIFVEKIPVTITKCSY